LRKGTHFVGNETCLAVIAIAGAAEEELAMLWTVQQALQATMAEMYIIGRINKVLISKSRRLFGYITTMVRLCGFGFGLCFALL
jgi:hypothetical protein